MGEPVIRPVPAWVKQPRCEACQHWLEPHDPAHPLLGRCSQRNITALVGGIFVDKLAPARNTGYCDSWKPVRNFVATDPFDVDALIDQCLELQLAPELPAGPVRLAFWNLTTALDHLRQTLDPEEWDGLKSVIRQKTWRYHMPDSSDKLVEKYLP